MGDDTDDNVTRKKLMVLFDEGLSHERKRERQCSICSSGLGFDDVKDVQTVHVIIVQSRVIYL
jgi:hypothetical protein